MYQWAYLLMTKLNIRVNWDNNLMNVHILVVCKNMINVMCVINVKKSMRSILNDVKSHILINKVLYNFTMFSHILYICWKLIKINTTWTAIIYKMSYGWCRVQQSFETFLQFQQKDQEVLHLMIICPWNVTHTKKKP